MSSSLPRDGESQPSVEGFLRTVLRSGLLDERQLEQSLGTIAPEKRGDAQAVADHLVRTGKLSRFQASKLLKGRAQGLLLGPYQVLALVGRGGIGTVYLVRDQRTSQLAALKILSPHRARSEERMRLRFQREMDLSRRVSHPHVARTFEVGQWKDIFYIAMEFIPGRSLSRLVADLGPLEVARAARLMAEVASGLGHAHRQGLVHRDLKPSNILVTPHGQAKLLDLGLALLEGEEVVDPQVVGGQGYIVGTMDYIAPEQTLDAAGVDSRADIYSLGCTIYYAVTGVPPFPGGTKRDKILKHRGETPTPLLQLNPSLPAGFVALVQRMMEKDPGRRLQTAQQAEEELLRWAWGDLVLLPDEVDEVAYAEAVSALQNAEPPSSYSWTELPGGQSSSESFTRVRDGRGEDRSPLWVGLGVAAGLLLFAALLLLLKMLTGW